WPSGGLAVAAHVGPGQPAVLADGSGGVTIAWEDYGSGADTDIQAQRITGSGALAAGWPTSGLSVCAATGSQYSPELNADGAGGAVVTWQEEQQEEPFDELLAAA